MEEAIAASGFRVISAPSRKLLWGIFVRYLIEDIPGD
jgi:hypothetical protein